MVKTEEQLRILELLQEGKITVDEASDLLDAVGHRQEPSPPGDHSRSEDRSDDRREIRIIRNGRAIDLGDMARHLQGAVAAIYGPGFGGGRRTRVRVDDDAPSRSGRPTFDQLVQASAVGVDPSYIRDMRRLVPSATFDEILHAGTVGIDVEYIKAMRDEFPELTMDQIIHAGAVGVSPEYVRAMRDEVDLEADDADLGRPTVPTPPTPPAPPTPPSPPTPPTPPASPAPPSATAEEDGG